MVKAVIFDWDGTLANTKQAVVQSFQTVLTEAGCRVSDEFIERLIGIGTKKTIIEAFRESNMRLDVSTLEKLATKKINIQAEVTDSVSLFEGAIELLDALKGNTKIGLATMSARKVINKLLSAKRITAYFEVVISADDVVNPKPDPEVFLVTAKNLVVDPKDCIVIEDSVFGVRAAKKAQMKCIAVSSGVYSEEELQKEQPELIVESLRVKEKILDFVFSTPC